MYCTFFVQSTSSFGAITTGEESYVFPVEDGTLWRYDETAGDFVQQMRQLEEANPAYVNDGGTSLINIEKSCNLSDTATLAKFEEFKAPAYSCAAATSSSRTTGLSSGGADIYREVLDKVEGGEKNINLGGTDIGSSGEDPSSRDNSFYSDGNENRQEIVLPVDLTQCSIEELNRISKVSDDEIISAAADTTRYLEILFLRQNARN